MTPRWDWVAQKWGVPCRVSVFHPGREYQGPALTADTLVEEIELLMVGSAMK